MEVFTSATFLLPMYILPISLLIKINFITSQQQSPEVFSKKGVLRNFAKFTGEHLCQSLFFNKVAGNEPYKFIKKETLAQVFSCEITKNSFSYRTLPVAVSDKLKNPVNFSQCHYFGQEQKLTI